MRNSRFVVVVLLLLVWSYFARPIYDFAWIALNRGRDIVAEKIEPPAVGLPYDDLVAMNTRTVAEIEAYITSRRVASAQSPLVKFDFSSLPAYQASTEPLRAALANTMDLPMSDAFRGTDFSGVKETPVGEDDLATYTLIAIPALPGVNMIGTLIEPKKHDPRMPLIIANHGRGGMPDRPPSGKMTLMGDSNRDLALGAVKRGWAVFEPIYLFYGTGYPVWIRDIMTARAVESGMTLPGIEITKLERTVDYLSSRPEIDPQRLGMIGMSYGGFYTLYTTALDPRIRVAVAAAYFNDRAAILDPSEPYGFLDWRFPDSITLFSDPHIVALICPRPLQIQSGTQDQLFPFEGSQRTIPLAKANYSQLHLDADFDFHPFTGRHDFDGEAAWDFVAKTLPVAK